MYSEKYEKPKMKYVQTCSNNNIADTCWGYAGTDTVLYCDIEGSGWTSFQISSGPCALNLTNVKYHTDSNGNGMADNQDIGVNITSDDARYQELYRILEAAGGGEGNPFKQMNITVIPDEPSGNWS